MTCARVERALHERGRYRRRQHRRVRAQLIGASPDRVGEPLASGAVTQVRAHGAPAQHPAVAGGNPASDLLTLHCSSLRKLEQGLARLEDGLLGAPNAGSQRGRDLLVRDAAELAQKQGAPSAIRKLGEVRHQRGPSCPLAGLVLGRGGGLMSVPCKLLARVPGAPPDHPDGFVVGDPEQPWAKRGVAPSTLQRRQRGRERGLQRILGVRLVTHDRAAVAVQRLVLAGGGCFGDS